MKYRNREVKLIAIFIICSLCILAKWISPVYAQTYLPSYYPYQSNAFFTDPFLNQGTMGANFFNSPQYPIGSSWGFSGNDLYSDIRVMPSFFSPGALHTSDMVQGELLVQFTDPYQINQEDLMKDFGISEMRPSQAKDLYVFKFPGGYDVSELQKALEPVAGIEFVEPNYIRRAHTTIPGSYTTTIGGNWGPTQSNTFQTWNSFTPQNIGPIYEFQMPFAPQPPLNSSFFSSYPGFDFYFAR